MKDIDTLKLLKKSLKWLWFNRSRIPFLNFPIPWRLPYGSWFLIYPDVMGLALLVPVLKKLPYYEEGEWRFLSKFLKPGMVCFDIGANQGFYTILMSQRVSPKGRVFAFEPTTGEFQKLKRNIRINHCNNLVLEKIAIGSYDGVTDMFVCLDGHGSNSSMRQPPKEVRGRKKIEKVPLTTLDSYVCRNNINQTDFIKVDVEGSERDVLIGMANVLVTLRPIIMIEMLDVTAQQFCYCPADNHRILEAYGFMMFEVTLNGFLKPTRLKNTYRENLVAVPDEKLKTILDFVEVS